MGGKKINIFREITYYNQFHQGETVKVTYLHDGEKHTATLVPKMDDELGYYRIGISGGGNTKANAWTSVQYGVYEVKFWVCTTFESLKTTGDRKRRRQTIIRSSGNRKYGRYNL